MNKSSEVRLNLDEPLWDLGTFWGRVKHFFWVTDPRTCIASEKELDDAVELLNLYREAKEPSGTTLEQVIYAKKLYESSHNPDSGERQNVMGRMSFQVPGGMAVTGAMLQFYRTVPAVIFWQWVNQSFNALVNYTNRNAKSPISTTQLGVAYVSATASAMITALGFKSYLARRANPFLQRYVPFVAVAAANCVNIPLMRQMELINGVDLTQSPSGGPSLTQSRVAAVKGHAQVIFSRIVMCAPGMLLLPVFMERLERYAWMRKIHVLHAPIQVFAVGGFLIFMVPMACALFPQQCSFKTSALKLIEPSQYQILEEATNGNVPEKLYFNKGL